MKLGTLMQDDEGNIQGRICGLGIGAIPIHLQPEVSRKGDPFFKIIADPLGEAYEVGVAFPKQKEGRAYHSVSLDSPLFAVPVNAAMFYDQTSGIYSLVWDRPPVATPKPDMRMQQGMKAKGQTPNLSPSA